MIIFTRVFRKIRLIGGYLFYRSVKPLEENTTDLLRIYAEIQLS